MLHWCVQHLATADEELATADADSGAAGDLLMRTLPQLLGIYQY